MLHSILSKLHEIPVYVYAAIIIVSVLSWAALAYLFQKQPFWKWLNVALFFLSFLLIISITLAVRQAGEQHYSLIPFSSFETAKIYRDVYQEITLNVVLYLPIGMTLPFVLFGHIRCPVIAALIFSIFLSSVIEFLQFIFMLGYAEIDDVIFNTLGSVFGVLSCVFYKWTKKRMAVSSYS